VRALARSLTISRALPLARSPAQGCILAAPGFWLKTICANASSGALNYYSNSFCQGTAVVSQQLSAIGLTPGCSPSASGSGSQSFACTSGTFSPSGAALTRYYSKPAACANASLYAPMQVSATTLGACVQMSGGFMPQYTMTTCNGSALTTNLYLGAACTGAPATTSFSQLACTDSPNGPSAITCNSGAGASQSPSASAAPSVAASVSVGASPSRTASPTPSRSAVAGITPLVVVTQTFDGAGCAGSPSYTTTQPNACFAGSAGSGPGVASSFTYACVNASYGTMTTFPNALCAAGSGGSGSTGPPGPQTVPIQGIGRCVTSAAGNSVTSTLVSCAPGSFAQPAVSAVISLYKPTDSCTLLSLAPDRYIAYPLGCTPRLGGAYSTMVSCNATTVTVVNYNGPSCNLPNGTGDRALALGVCSATVARDLGLGSGPVKVACNNVIGASTSAAPSRSPTPTPSLSFGASASVTPSNSPAAATPSPSASLAFHPTFSIPAPPGGFREDPVWAPTDPTTRLPLAGLEVPAGPGTDIFCDKCPVPPSTVELYMSALVFAEIPTSVDASHVSASLQQMAWSRGGGLAALAASDPQNHTVTRSEVGGEWFSAVNVRCRTPSNPSGVCALRITVTYPNAAGGVGELPFRVWYKTFSNTAPPAAAAAPSAAVPLGAAAGGPGGALCGNSLLLHWLRVLTVPCLCVFARAMGGRERGESESALACPCAARTHVRAHAPLP
jgi:hypothetical protein